MITTILHWTCDSTSASMASLLFRWAIALAMLDAAIRSAETFPSGKRYEVSEGLFLFSTGRVLLSRHH